MNPRLAVAMTGITKRFSSVPANDSVDFDVATGEVHALLGENGAGKSTLMNILFGFLQPNAGEIRIRGELAVIRSPADALLIGIGMVSQHFHLVPNMTVTDNVVLGQEPKRRFLLDHDEAERRVEAVSARYGLRVPLERKVSDLSLGEKQRVEILKALYRGARILILDEPTACLSPSDAASLFEALRAMKADGLSVILISHKLTEVLSICDRVTVMRRGKVVGTVAARASNAEDLAVMMCGRPIDMVTRNSGQRRPPSDAEQQTVASVRDVYVHLTGGKPQLAGVSLDLLAGEVVGIAGVEGNGQKELVEVILGLTNPSEGESSLLGFDSNRRAKNRLGLEIGYVPADRQKQGSVLRMSVASNAILKAHNRRPFARYGFSQHRAKEAFARQVIAEFGIVCSSTDSEAATLSGGNLQRLILARETANQPRLLIAENPTRGLDIAAAEFVRNVLLDLRDRGTSILLVSADLDEIMAMSDRIVVMYEGQIRYAADTFDADFSRIASAMGGHGAPAANNVAGLEPSALDHVRDPGSN